MIQLRAERTQCAGWALPGWQEPGRPRGLCSLGPTVPGWGSRVSAAQAGSECTVGPLAEPHRAQRCHRAQEGSLGPWGGGSMVGQEGTPPPAALRSPLARCPGMQGSQARPRSPTNVAAGQDSPTRGHRHHPPGLGARWLTWACLRFRPGRPAFLMGVPGSCFSSLLGFSSGSSSPCEPDTERTVTPPGSPGMGMALLLLGAGIAGTTGTAADGRLPGPVGAPWHRRASSTRTLRRVTVAPAKLGLRHRPP